MTEEKRRNVVMSLLYDVHMKLCEDESVLLDKDTVYFMFVDGDESEDYFKGYAGGDPETLMAMFFAQMMKDEEFAGILYDAVFNYIQADDKKIDEASIYIEKMKKGSKTTG